MSKKHTTFTILSVILFIFAIPSYVFAQTGPGGVGANNGGSSLIMWYRPDNGLSTTGTLIDSWLNSAGIPEFNMSETNTLRPTLNVGTVNGYGEVAFNGSNRMRTGYTLTATNFIVNEASSFLMAKANKTSQTSCVYTTDNLESSTRFSNHIPWNGTVYYDIGQCCSSSSRLQVGGLTGLLDYSIWSYDAHPASGKQLYRNEDLLVSRGGSSTYNSYASQQFNIGGFTGGTNGFEGNITELAIYKEKVNAAQRIIIDNYLSSKYNNALTANDFYIQDDVANGNFDHNVAGIGQASDGSSHTDSQGTGIVRIHTPSALSNNDFLFWGEETKAPSYALVTETTNYTEQLNSKWRVSKIGNLGTVTVAFDITDFSTAIHCDQFKMIVDNDSDFSSPITYNLTVSGTIATATGVVFSDNDYFTVRNTDQIVWDGTTFFNGSGASNAPNDTDECLKLTVKAGSTAILNVDAHVREIEIEAGGVLQVADGILLEVENGIVNNGTINLLNEAQLIQNHTGTSLNSGSGNLTGVQQGSSNLYNYNYWSSPVQRNGNWKINYLETAAGSVSFTSSNNASTSGGSTMLSSRWLYTFNGLTNAYADWNYITPATEIAPGLGYTMKGSGNTVDAEQEYVFKGTANDGDIVISVSAGDEILVGNPYPSALDAHQFISDNNASVIDGTIYFYEHFDTNDSHVLSEYQGGYATLNLVSSVEAPGSTAFSKGAPTGNISVAQGFFVRVIASGDVIFKNSQRIFARESLNEATFYRTAQEAVTDTRIKYWLSFTSSEDYEYKIALGYDINASSGFDNGYDSRVLNEKSNEIYWTIPDEELRIQGLHDFQVSDEIPLGVHVTDAGNYTFTISETLNFPEGETIYLKDNVTNSFYDISQDSVTLNLSEGVYNSRFVVVYQNAEALSIEDVNTNEISVFYNMNSDTLVLDGIENLSAIKSLNINNILGQNMANFNAIESNEINLSVLKTGIYVAEITQDNGVTTKLKFVKR
ncbi:T9SS type A sorting domain-containing protein [Lacinutrix undariae]